MFCKIKVESPNFPFLLLFAHRIDFFPKGTKAQKVFVCPLLNAIHNRDAGEGKRKSHYSTDYTKYSFTCIAVSLNKSVTGTPRS